MADPPDVQVALTFDFDAFSNWIGSLGATSPSMLSRGEFGPIGLRRILALLDEYELPATFFVPGHTAMTFPAATQAIAEAGHEIGHHGWVHENPARLDVDAEREALERGLAALDATVGVRPLGYRSPGWDNSADTVQLLLEHGFEYESSLMGNDYDPYWCRVGDVSSTTAPYVFGRPVALVEMPVALHLDDWPYFENVTLPGVSRQGLQPPSAVREIWQGELDYLHRHIGNGVLVLTMHPQVIGRGHRLLMLRQFIEYALQLQGVGFTDCIDYVRRWRNGRSPSLPADATAPRVSETGSSDR